MRGQSGTECGDDPEQNAGTISTSILEHLLVFKAIHRDDPETNAGTIHASNREHLLVFKAPRGYDPEQNAWDDPRVLSGTPLWGERGRVANERPGN